MKRSILLIVLLFLAAALATAATRPRYRIELRNGESILAMDRPVHRGTIVLFHSYPKQATIYAGRRERATAHIAAP